MENRFATQLNRAAQSVLRAPDLQDQLVTVRAVLPEHLKEGRPQVGFGPKTFDSTYVLTGQFLYHGRLKTLRFIFLGELADRAVSENVVPGTKITVTGMIQAITDPESGQLVRMPKCYVEVFEKEDGAKTQVAPAVSKAPGVEEL